MPCDAAGYSLDSVLVSAPLQHNCDKLFYDTYMKCIYYELVICTSDRVTQDAVLSVKIVPLRH